MTIVMIRLLQAMIIEYCSWIIPNCSSLWHFSSGKSVLPNGTIVGKTRRLGFLQVGFSSGYAMWHPTPTWKAHVGTPLKPACAEASEGRGRSTMVHKISAIF